MTHICPPDRGFCPDCGRAQLDVLRSLNVSPSATPTRTRRVMSDSSDAAKRNSNAWERGIAVDRRGMPFLDEHLEPVSIKEFTENRYRWDHKDRQPSREAVDTKSV